MATERKARFSIDHYSLIKGHNGWDKLLEIVRKPGERASSGFRVVVVPNAPPSVILEGHSVIVQRLRLESIWHTGTGYARW